MKGHDFYDEPAKYPLSTLDGVNLGVFHLDNSIFFRSIDIANQQLLLLSMLYLSNFWGSDWDLQALLVLAIAQHNYLTVFGDHQSYIPQLK
ncbi:MAG: hypothetical protein AAGE96_13890 [Cyanobacteria bacterium P01_G01_bin.19]